MQKIFEKVYFITKLSSSILLLIILAVLVYIFSRAYLDQYNLANDNYVDQISHINKEIESKFENPYVVEISTSLKNEKVL